MKEDFLQFIWKHQLYNLRDLRLRDGRALTVLNKGVHNRSSGPDFKEAKILIDGQLWMGSVEIHLKESDWEAHEHSNDANYGNVILHVVLQGDRPVKGANGEELPVLELENRLEPEVYRRFYSLMERDSKMLCKSQLSEVEPITLISQLDRVLVERMEQKSEEILSILDETKNDWQQTTFIWLAKAFGGNQNGAVFSEVAKNLPYTLLRKYGESEMQCESLILGMGGWLDDDIKGDPYYLLLQRESLFLFLKHDLKAKKLKKSQFATGQMRPANHPVFRLVQLASLVKNFPDLFGFLTNTIEPKELREALSLIRPSEYWEDRYHFGHQLEKKRSAKIASSLVDHLIVNAVSPLLVGYSRFSEQEEWTERAINLLSIVGYEDNALTREFPRDFFSKKTAGDSQAQIQQYKKYCLEKRCLECGIGVSLIKERR